MVFRFYFRCSKCGAEITMKTDPKNSDYTMEAGASRNYEPWREKDKVRSHAPRTVASFWDRSMYLLANSANCRSGARGLENGIGDTLL